MCSISMSVIGHPSPQTKSYLTRLYDDTSIVHEQGQPLTTGLFQYLISDPQKCFKKLKISERIIMFFYKMLHFLISV